MNRTKRSALESIIEGTLPGRVAMGDPVAGGEFLEKPIE